MRRGTTPTHTFTLPFDVSMISKLHIIYAQNEQVVLTKSESDATLDGNTVVVKLSQEETLLFDCKRNTEVQVRVLTLGGEAITSDIIRVATERCLENEVIE